jgi:hypothetical protein
VEGEEVSATGLLIRVADYSDCDTGDDEALVLRETVTEGFALKCLKCGRGAYVTIYKNLDTVDDQFTPLSALVGCGWCDDEDVELSAPAPPSEETKGDVRQ